MPGVVARCQEVREIMTATSIADLLPARRMIPRLRSRTKRHALRSLAKCLATDVPTAKDAIMGAVSACADYPAFGPGTGVALLHAIVPGLEKPIAAAARLDPALNFGALDGSSTDIVVLLLSPPGGANLNLRALACLARRLRREDVRRHLRGAEDPDSMYVVMVGDEIGAPEYTLTPHEPKHPTTADPPRMPHLELVK
jgi:nitrogen PTS system EIIA component